MKAETLLTLLKKCVLCLFLCVVVSQNSIANEIDTLLLRQAIVGQIHRVTKSRPNDLVVVGDTTIAKYIPTRYTSGTGGQKLFLKKLQYTIDSTSIEISFGMVQPEVFDDVAGIALVTSTINIDSLRNSGLNIEAETNESFWDDALQPILVTAGAAAVIALFFFVKF